jgi:Papain-like cysteine protease AvrRpt2
MPIIKAKFSTWLKRFDADSRMIDAADKIKIDRGDALGGTLDFATGQSLSIKLAGASSKYSLKAGDTWFLYSPDWEIPANMGLSGKPAVPSNIKLKVPYFAQIDTRPDGWRYCCAHSNAMLAAFCLGENYFRQAQNYNQAEQYYIDELSQFGDTTDHNANTATLESLGIKSYWSQRLSPKDIQCSLLIGMPVVVGFAYKVSGHICIIVGRDGGDWLVHDPYGRRNGTSNSYFIHSTDGGREGAYDRYSAAAMDAIFWDQGGSDRESGWGRIVTSIKGLPVGNLVGL